MLLAMGHLAGKLCPPSLVSQKRVCNEPQWGLREQVEGITGKTEDPHTGGVAVTVPETFRAACRQTWSMRDCGKNITLVENVICTREGVAQSPGAKRDASETWNLTLQTVLPHYFANKLLYP